MQSAISTDLRKITVDGKRAEWSVQRNCSQAVKWNQKLGRATGTKEEVRILNAYLDAIQGNIFSIQKNISYEMNP